MRVMDAWYALPGYIFPEHILLPQLYSLSGSFYIFIILFKSMFSILTLTCLRDVETRYYVLGITADV